MLTTLRAPGVKLTLALDEAREAGDQQLVSDALGSLLTSYVQQILVGGHFQADPHPGNLLYDAGAGLTILDFGCAKELDDASRRSYVRLMQAFFVSDRDTLVRELDALGFRTESGAPDTLLAFADALLGELRRAAEAGSFELRSTEELLAEAQDLLVQAEADPVIAIPPSFVMIARVFGTIGGLFAHYEPDVNLEQSLFPVLLSAMQ